MTGLVRSFHFGSRFKVKFRLLKYTTRVISLLIAGWFYALGPFQVQLLNHISSIFNFTGHLEQFVLDVILSID